MSHVQEETITAVSHPENGSQTVVGNIGGSQGVAIGEGATAVHIEAMGNVGDVVTGTKISLINQTAAIRIASKRQISAPPNGYIERPEAETALRELLTKQTDGLQVVHLHGLTGVGKSWLARKVATELEDFFVDGMLWTNLEQTKFRTAIKHFIEPYNPKINHNSLRSNSEYVAAMAEAFCDQRILVVLDQIDDSRDGIKEWLPYQCPNCVFLLISQQQSISANKFEDDYRLLGMTEGEALQLFAPLLSEAAVARAQDDTVLLELAGKLDRNPGAMTRVLKDITTRQISPQHYLEELSNQNENGALDQNHLLSLENIYENLPDEGKEVFPFLGILHTVPWTIDDLFTISRKNSRIIQQGLVQLTRAGLIEKGERQHVGQKRPFIHYHTPTIISNFAYNKLIELGGQQLVAAMTVLQASDTMRKVEMVLRYLREALLRECWQDENSQDLLMQSINKQFANPISTINQKSEEDRISIFAVPRDPLLDFFENLILSNESYAARWLSMLRATDFYILRNQLDEVFDKALENEDWPLLRQFATNINVNTRWIIDKKFEKADGGNWDNFCYRFPLLKKLEVNNIELINVTLKSPNIKTTYWQQCQFIATKWLGAYIFSSTFDNIDMVGVEMPGGIITNCRFKSVDARYGDFRGTMFQKCIFDDVNFRGAKFEKTQFIDCYFFNSVDFRLTQVEEMFKQYS